MLVPWSLTLMDRPSALALMHEYTASLSLRRHMLAVEAAMRAYARKFGEDEEKWGLVGLLHDFDYERWPDPPDHPLKGAAILAERGYPADMIYAIKSHADYLARLPACQPARQGAVCVRRTGRVSSPPARWSGPSGWRACRRPASRRSSRPRALPRASTATISPAVRPIWAWSSMQHIQFVIDAMTPIADELGWCH